jgi:ABC-2 type transport system permease protein
MNGQLRQALRLIGCGMRAEGRQVLRAPGFVVLVLTHALVLMSLVVCFGLSGSRAPVAVVLEDASPAAEAFLRCLEGCHHSFAVETADARSAERELTRGRISSIITIPAGFGMELARSHPVVISCEIDNVNADLSEDIRRALPSAIVAFGILRDPAALSVRLREHDRCGRDTGFISYLAVSALALDALAISAVLAALVMTRDREAQLHQHWDLAPWHPGYLLGGRLLVSQLISAVAILAPVLAVVAVVLRSEPAHGVVHAAALAGTLALLVATGGALGMAVGVVVPRSGAATALILGLALALYLISGALEPQRFDGEAIWYLAHASPGYAAVGLCEYAVHGLVVTPEGLGVLVLMLAAWLACGVAIAAWRLPTCVRR